MRPDCRDAVAGQDALTLGELASIVAATQSNDAIGIIADAAAVAVTLATSEAAAVGLRRPFASPETG